MLITFSAPNFSHLLPPPQNFVISYRKIFPFFAFNFAIFLPIQFRSFPLKFPSENLPPRECSLAMRFFPHFLSVKSRPSLEFSGRAGAVSNKTTVWSREKERRRMDFKEKM